MEFRLLGPLEVIDGQRALRLGGPKQRLVLAHLLLRPRMFVPADRLIDEVWWEEPPAAARNVLQTYVSHLRKTLGPERLEGRSRGYVLHVEPSEVDAFRFEALVQEARRLMATDPAGAVGAYEEALALWRAGALDDLADQPSLRPEIARLEDLRLAATEERIGAALELGRHRQVVQELDTLTRAHPLREQLWAHLMTALYRSGRQAEALACYRRARELLADELGLDPSPELRRLHAQILRQDPALDVAGEPLRGYRLLEQVGAGAFGSVHRALQPQVGREVAVKAIHPRFANDPDFVRRFEAEAQLVARLEHPHIVPLYDFWREPEGAYLVMRYLRGGSLRERLAEGPVAPEEAIGLVEQIAQALAAAHRQGIVHRDVKPANVLFDEEDNAYLSDFGIAREVAAAELAAAGAFAGPLAYYISPEEIRGEPATARTDVYGLGVLLYETLAGRHPFAACSSEEILDKQLREPFPSILDLRPDLPEGVQEVISRATAKDPVRRYAETAELAHGFRHALAPSSRPAVARVPEARNPYKGLRPFAEADAPDFFGREALVAELVARLAQPGEASRFLALVGPSGSGKSSVVRAGLVPALRRGAVPGSADWFVVDMHPGAHPFEELRTALMRVATEPARELAERLERDDRGLVRAAEEIVGGDGELLLVLDQFEELFTLVDDEDVRARFVSCLEAAATDATSRLRLVVALRADFYDRPLSYPGLAELMKAGTVAVTPLTPEELEQAVSRPAERVGIGVDPPVVADIVAEVAAQPGALPLVQYALTELYDHGSDATLTVEAYSEIGGVSGALVRRAEDLYGSLNEAGQEATRQLFLRLVTLGEEGSDDTRRRVLRAELTSLEVDREAIEASIETFGARRLLSFDRDPVTRGPTVEVAHEALLREWARLRGWIEAARDDVRAHRRLAAAARDWTAADRDPGYLLRGAQLVRFEGRTASSGLALTGDERAYLEASLAERDAERAEEEARAERERALERRSVMRLRALVVVLAAAALVAAALTVFAFDQRGRAQREARAATARELAAAAVASLDLDPERSILLALEAVEATREADGKVLREAEEALHRAVHSSRIVLRVPQGGWDLAVSPDGVRFVTTGSDRTDGTATIWDTNTGERLQVLRTPAEPPGVAFSPDNRLVATTQNDGTVRLWDAATGQSLRALRGREEPMHPVFSPDGRWLATGTSDGTVRIWDVAAGREARTLRGREAETIRVAFSPDGARLASASANNSARIWDLAGGKTVAVLKGHRWAVAGVDFSPDGTRLVTASIDASVRIWDAESGAHLRTVATPASVHAVDYSPDGTRIATAGNDSVARIWDADTGRELLALAGHAGGGVVNLAFTPDGSRLLTAGLDGTTRLWDVGVRGGRDWLTVPAAELIYVGVAFSPDGRTFAAPAEPSGVTVWDTQTGEEVTTLTGYEPKLTTVAFSPDGRRIAAGSDLARTPPVWDVATGELLFTLEGHEGSVRAVAFSPDGSRIVTGSGDGTARVWDATGEERAVLRLGRDGVGSAAFSPDGHFIVTGDAGGDVTVWDAVRLEKIRTLSGHAGLVAGLAFGPRGTLVTASEDGTAKVWDIETREVRATFRGHRAPVYQAAFSPDGALVVTGSHDLTAKLWDPATGEEVLTLFGHDSLVFGVDFSPDGRLLATASPDGTVALHLLPIDELVELARTRVTRSLTDEECRQYLHVERCPKATS